MFEQDVSTNIAALWYKRRHRYVDNQRVKLKVVLPTIAMAKFAIDNLESILLFTLEINREIFIPIREVGRYSLLLKKSGDLPPNREAWKLWVYRKLSNLKCNKATGCDEKPAKILKIVSQNLATPPASISNASIKQSRFPQDLKLAHVSPVYKKK